MSRHRKNKRRRKADLSLAVHEAIVRSLPPPSPDSPRGTIASTTAAGKRPPPPADELTGIPSIDRGPLHSLPGLPAALAAAIGSDTYATLSMDTPSYHLADTRPDLHVYHPFRMYQPDQLVRGEPVSEDLAALLAAVKANRDADAPRLVLADWLEESHFEGGTRWAQLIRSLCGHALATSTDGLTDSPGFSFLNHHRGRGFVANVGAPSDNGRWQRVTAEVELAIVGTDFEDPGRVRLTIDGGMVQLVDASLEAWSLIGPELVRWHPVSFVSVTNRNVKPYDFESGWNPLDARHFWWSGGRPTSVWELDRHGCARLPDDILPGRRDSTGTGRQGFVRFRTRGLANRFLSACLIHSAQKVNLREDCP